MNWIVFALSAALSWGAYGVVLHKGQVALGNRGAAIAEYQRLRADLKRALDVDPLPETDQAVQKLLGSAIAGAARIPQPQPAQ